MSETEDDNLLDSDEITFLNVEQVIKLHDQCISEFSPNESRAILDRNLLESAVITPTMSFDGQLLYDSIEKMAAAYMAGLAANHAFENGNKRVALSAGSVFLRMNGYKLTLGQDEAEILILDLVNHTIDREQAAIVIFNAIQPL